MIGDSSLKSWMKLYTNRSLKSRVEDVLIVRRETGVVNTLPRDAIHLQPPTFRGIQMICDIPSVLVFSS
jgi:hypothetical protein